ncbi:hypothetical protein [Bacillus benzoevorans]|uniref:Uncharacterized protein n=1 Tax=Bacillus benzoevorans TaxID=1456 RepID=A0A7X0HVW2_9BACI|nr:hypothetical protein [Bacillus benzoevorans]MBB6447819.1 hypothetical protein [Bacillus benzoevorans]
MKKTLPALSNLLRRFKAGMKAANGSVYLKIEKNGRIMISREKNVTAIAPVFCFSFHNVTAKPKV